MNTECLFSVSQLEVAARGKKILSVPDLEIDSGGHTVVVGPNGAGKSTLLRALLGYGHTGAVLFRGRPVAEAVRKGQIAWVGQHGSFNLPLNVAEYVWLGRYPHGGGRKAGSRLREKMAYLFEVFELRHLADTRIGRLSGGEQQRANIVRALLQEAPVMLLDEPCNHLDIRHQHLLMHYLDSRQDEFNAVIVLHDLSLAANHARYAVLMEGGSVAVSGSPGEVLTADRLSAVYRWPVRRYEESGSVFFRMGEAAASSETAGLS